MNVVFIITLVLFLFGALNGLRKGLIRTVFSTFALIAALILAAYAGPNAAKFLKTTGFYDNICNKVESVISLEIGDAVDTQVTKQVEAINQLPFPDGIKEGLIENNNKEIYNALGIDRFAQYVANYVAMLVVNVLSYILVFIVAYIVLKIVGWILENLAELPVLDGMNHIGGLILGSINGFVAIWVLYIIFTMFCTTSWGLAALQQIDESFILRFIYNHNYLLEIIKNIGKILF